MDVNQLISAAYASQISYAAGLTPSLQGNTLSSQVAGFSPADSLTPIQSTEITADYRVVQQYEAAASGFAGVLLERISSPGDYTLALRGSSSYLADPDWLDANPSNGLLGTSVNQVMDLVNFYLRLTSSGTVNQYNFDQIVIDRDDPPPTTGHVYLGSFASYEFYGKIGVETTVQAYGAITPSTQLTVTGHSLGGHLASSFALLFPAVTLATYTFNSAGFLGWLGDLFPAAANLIANGVPELAITPQNAASATAFNYVAPLDLISRIPGTAHLGGALTEVGTEIKGDDIFSHFIENHSIDRVVDTLAVINLLNSIDGNVTLEVANGILDAASNTSVHQLEWTANHIARLFNQTIPGIGDTDHDQVYQTIADVDEALSDAPYQIQFLGNQAVDDYVAIGSMDNSETSRGYRQALAATAPFALTSGIAGTEADDTTYDLENFSTQRLEDLAYMLHTALGMNQREDQHGGLNTLTTFTNLESGISFHGDHFGYITPNKPLPNFPPEYFDHDRSRIVFGSSADNTPSADTIVASDNDDHLYGLEGQDIIQGLAGDDYIEGGTENDFLDGGSGSDLLQGGKGNDHIVGGAGTDYLLGNEGADRFYWNDGDGDDVIGDYDDGGDRIVVNGTDLATLNLHQFTANSPYYRDNATPGLVLRYDGADLTVFVNSGPDSGEIFLGQYSPLTGSDYGISLNSHTPAPPTVSNVTVTQIGTADHEVDWQAYSRLWRNQGSVDWATASINFTASNVPGYSGSTELPILSYVGFEGGPANDHIEGDNLNERLSGLGGDDLIAGQDGFNWLEGWQGSDILIGGAGTDVIFGNVAPDLESKLDPMEVSQQYLLTFIAEQPDDLNVIDGGAGQDLLVGGEYSDNVAGGPGADYLWGGTGNDILSGGSGTDQMLGDSAMTYVSQQTPQGINSSAVTAWANGSDPVDLYDDQMFGGDGNDYLWGELGNDTLHGEAGDDYLVGDRDTLTAPDQIPFTSLSGTDPYLASAYHGDDELYGGAGDDILIGLGGDDLLSGGAGNDALWGGDGNDIYVLRPGDETAHVIDAQGQHTLLFQGIQPEALQVVFHQGTVIIGTETESLTLSRSEWNNTSIAFGDAENVVDRTRLDTVYLNAARETVLFINGLRSISEAELAEIFTVDDSNSEQPIFVLGPAAGSIVVEDPATGAQSTSLQISDTNQLFAIDLNLAVTQPEDLLALFNLEAAPDVGLSITTAAANFDGTNGDDNISGTAVANTFYGRGGHDTLEGNGGDDRLDGEGGNDTLLGGTGDDTLNGGFGHDTLLGGPGSDQLYGLSGNDTLQGGTGDDELISHPGANYVFSRGDGHDTIVIDHDRAADANGTIVFSDDVDINSIEIVKNSASSSTIHYGAGDSIELEMSSILVGQDSVLSRLSLQWEGAPEEPWLITEGTGSNYMYGTYGDDHLIGENLAFTIIPGYGDDIIETSVHDSYVHLNHIYLNNGGGIGHKEIYFRGEYEGVFTPVHQGISYYFEGVGQFSSIEYDWSYEMRNPYNINVNAVAETVEFIPHGEDVLHFGAGIYFSDLSFTRLGNHLEITIRDDVGEVRIDNFFTAYGVDAPIVDISEISTGSFVPDLLTHPYVLSAMPDSPIARIELFDGSSRTMEQLFSGGLNEIDLLPGITFLGTRRDDEVEGRLDTDDVIQTREGDDTIYEAGGSGANLIDAGAGADFIEAHGNNTIHAGKGDDTVKQTSGTGVIHAGDGNDSLTIEHTSNYVVHGDGGDDLIFQTGGNATIDGGTGDDKIVASGNGALFGGAGDDSFTINSGNGAISGGEGDDFFFVTGGDRTLITGDGNDQLGMLNGKITVEDSAGDDIYTVAGGDAIVHFGAEPGHKVLLVAQYTNPTAAIEMAPGLTSQDVVFSEFQQEYGTGIRLEVPATGSSIDLFYQVGIGETTVFAAGRSVNEIRFSNGEVLPEAQIVALAAANAEAFISGTSGPDSLTGTAAADTIKALGGDDSISGLAGDDIIRGGAGNDDITGGAGDDILRGEGGNDTFHVAGNGDGFDQILAEDGFDTLLGSSGNDFIGLTDIDYLSGLERIDGAGGFDVIGGNADDNHLNFSSMELLNIVAVLGGEGDDELFSASSGTILFGQQGNDTLTGGAGNDQFRVEGTGHGFDTIDAGGGFDQLIGSNTHDLIGLVDLSIDHSLERIDGVSGFDVIVGDSAANRLDFSATELNNIVAIVGGEGDDHIVGSNGGDILIGGAGNDTLSGGQGSDLYQMSSGDGADLILNADSNVNSQDELKLVDIAYSDLWFSRNGNDLLVDVVGNNDQARIQDWYADDNAQLAAFHTEGHVLLRSQVDQLVSAMAAFAVPQGVGAVVTEDTRLQLEPTLTAVWQAA